VALVILDVAAVDVGSLVVLLVTAVVAVVRLAIQRFPVAVHLLLLLLLLLILVLILLIVTHLAGIQSRLQLLHLQWSI